MKNKIYNLFLIIGFALVLSCADPDLDPLLSEQVKKGTFLSLRGTQLDEIYFNGTYACGGGDAFYYNSVTGTEVFEFDAVFLAEDQSTLGSIECFVNKKEGKVTTKVPLGITKQASDFSNSTDGEKFKKITVSIPLSTILSKIGVDPKTTAGQKTLADTYGEVGIIILTDLTLSNGTKITADELVAPGLQASDVFYPAQRLNYCLLDVNDYKPAVTITRKKSVPLKGAGVDSIFLTYDADEITNTPTAVLSIVAAGTNTISTTGTLGTVTKYKTTKNKFYALYTAPSDYTGPVQLTVSGAQASISGTNLTQNSTTFDIAVDNTAPIMRTTFATGTSPTRIGKGQSTVISATFNEAVDISGASIDVRGQNLDTLGFQSFTLSSDKLTISYAYRFKDSEAPSATHGQLTITVKGIKDLAGNNFLFPNGSTSIVNTSWLTCDLATPNTPVVSVGATYDYGDQLYITGKADTTGTNVGAIIKSSTSGTIYYIAVERGGLAPVQTTGGGFDTSADDFESVTSGSFAASNSAQYIPFTANGDIDLYFYFVNSTGNTSLNTTVPLQITMR